MVVGVLALVLILVVSTIWIKIKRKNNNGGVHIVETKIGITTTNVGIKPDSKEGGDSCKKGFDTKEIGERDKFDYSVSAVTVGIQSAFV